MVENELSEEERGIIEQMANMVGWEYVFIMCKRSATRAVKGLIYTYPSPWQPSYWDNIASHGDLISMVQYLIVYIYARYAIS